MLGRGRARLPARARPEPGDAVRRLAEPEHRRDYPRRPREHSTERALAIVVAEILNGNKVAWLRSQHTHHSNIARTRGLPHWATPNAVHACSCIPRTRAVSFLLHPNQHRELHVTASVIRGRPGSTGNDRAGTKGTGADRDHPERRAQPMVPVAREVVDRGQRSALVRGWAFHEKVVFIRRRIKSRRAVGNFNVRMNAT